MASPSPWGEGWGEGEFSLQASRPFKDRAGTPTNPSIAIGNNWGVRSSQGCDKHVSRPTACLIESSLVPTSTMKSIRFKQRLLLRLAFWAIWGLLPAVRAATTSVSVGDNFFSPSSVTINMNDSVKWTWTGNNQ